MTTYTTAQDEMLDAICRRLGGTERGGVVEAFLAANPGLAGLGPVLPLGTLITLPEPIAPPKSPRRATINLWD